MDFFNNMDDSQKIILGIAVVTLLVAAYLYFSSGRRNERRIGGGEGLQISQDDGAGGNGSAAEQPIDNGVTQLEHEPSNRVMVMFFSPGCGHCTNMMPAWHEFTQNFDGYNGTKILLINGAENQQLSQMHGVQGFPTVKFCPNGLEDAQSAVVYQGDRSVASLADFLQQMA
jgi:thiol-disulfide isomerase/thioredoxin